LYELILGNTLIYYLYFSFTKIVIFNKHDYQNNL
jgi:hypothetical protein